MMKWLPLIQDSKRKLDESKLLKYILKYKLVNNKSMTDTHWHYIYISNSSRLQLVFIQGTIGCIPNSVPMVFIVFSRDSWGL